MARSPLNIRSWRLRLLCTSVLILAIQFFGPLLKGSNKIQQADSHWVSRATTRKLLSTVEWEKCTFEVGHERNHSIDTSEWYTPQSAYGWVVAYILAILVVFVALAIVCDDFFVPSLEVISEKLDLSEDVAGATFMAAGSSAPELFTSIAGVTVESDVGVGTIVGSAVFNLLGIVALSAAFAGKVLHLDWRPLTRDAIFYALSIFCFIIFSWDGQFELYESIIMLLLYFMYIVIMKFNPQLMELLAKCGKKSIHPRDGANPAAQYIDGNETPKIDRSQIVDVMPDSPDHVAYVGVKSTEETTTSPVRKFSHTKKGQITSIVQGKSDHEMPKGDNHVIGSPTAIPESNHADANRSQAAVTVSNGNCKTTSKSTSDVNGAVVTSSVNSGKSPDPLFNYKDNSEATPAPNDEDGGNIIICPCLPAVQIDSPSKPNTKYCMINWARYLLNWILFIVSMPFVIAFTWTIPNCSKPHLQKYYLLSFTMSIVWIALLSFAMVTLVGRCGCILGVDRFTMGLVIVAIGTSVPDALSSILVARDGFGDMAVSNAIGSNVFDIDLGLGLPFVISILIRNMKPVKLLNKRDQELFDAGKLTIIPHVKFGFILIIILVLSLAVFILSRFTLNKKLGACLVCLYFAFVVYAYIQDIYCDHGC